MYVESIDYQRRSVTTVGAYAFYVHHGVSGEDDYQIYSGAMSSLAIATSVQNLGQYSFYYSSIITLVLPSSVTFIDTVRICAILFLSFFENENFAIFSMHSLIAITWPQWPFQLHWANYRMAFFSIATDYSRLWFPRKIKKFGIPNIIIIQTKYSIGQ